MLHQEGFIKRFGRSMQIPARQNYTNFSTQTALAKHQLSNGRHVAAMPRATNHSSHICMQVMIEDAMNRELLFKVS
jgi:hypothetical protein